MHITHSEIGTCSDLFWYVMNDSVIRMWKKEACALERQYTIALLLFFYLRQTIVHLIVTLPVTTARRRVASQSVRENSALYWWVWRCLVPLITHVQYKIGKGGRIRFEVRIAINLMHRIRVFESINRIGFNAEKWIALRLNEERSANQDWLKWKTTLRYGRTS